MSILSARLRRFRFTLRELLAAMVLLAVGLTLPWLMLIIAPLLVAAILSRLGLGKLSPLAAAAALSVTFGIVVSWYYWRYPFRPPAPITELRDISVVVQLSEVHGLNPLRGEPPEIQAMARVPPAGSVQWDTPHGLYPTLRILQDLGEHRIGIE